MKPIATISLCCLITFISNAQQINVKLSNEAAGKPVWGNTVKAGNKYIHYNEIGSRDHLQYGFGWNKVRLGLELVQYDANMQELKKLSLGEGKRIYGPFLTGIRNINGNVYVIYHEIKPKNMIGNIMAVKINPETLETETPKVIANISDADYDLKFSESLQYDLKFYLSCSPDQKKTVLLLTAGGNQFFMSVLDSNLNVIRGKKETFAETGSFEYKSVCVDNAGNAYLSYKIYNTETEKSNTKSRLAVYRISGKATDLVLNMDVATSKHIVILPSAYNNQVHIAGSYMENSDAKYLRGVFYAVVNPANTKAINVRKIPFPDTLVQQFANDGWGSTKTKNFGLDMGIVPQLYEKEDGTISMTAEFRRREAGTKTIFDVSGDILSVGFSKTAASFSRIPKYRVSAGSTIGDSYYAIPCKDKMLIFYDDNEDNLKKSISASPDNSNVYKNSVLLAAVVDSAGKVNRQLVLDAQKENYLALTEYIYLLEPGRMLLPLQKIKSLGGAADNMKWATIEVF